MIGHRRRQRLVPVQPVPAELNIELGLAEAAVDQGRRLGRHARGADRVQKGAKDVPGVGLVVQERHVVPAEDFVEHPQNPELGVLVEFVDELFERAGIGAALDQLHPAGARVAIEIADEADHLDLAVAQKSVPEPPQHVLIGIGQELR